MKRLLFIVCTIALVVGSISCVREIELDADDPLTVVVECVLVDAPVQTLKLMLTKGTAEEEAPVIEEAEVTLIDLTDNIDAGLFERQDDMTWTLDYQAIPEHSYRLEVRVTGYDPVWAEQTMPLECRAMSTFYADWSSSSYHTYSSHVNGSLILLTHTPLSTWIRAMNYNPETGNREIAEHICTDAPYVDNFNLTGGVYDPPVTTTILPSGESSDRYLYANLEGYSLHKRFLRLDTDKVLEAEVLQVGISISGSFTGEYFNNGTAAIPADKAPREDEGIVIVSIVSDDYDLYLRDAIKYQQLSESSDLSSVYSLSGNVYSNIHGGLGIFGAKTEKVVEWNPFYWVKLSHN